MTVLEANYAVCMREQGRKTSERLSLTARAGDSVFIHTGSARCGCHFEVLSGLRSPQLGTVTIQGTELYGLPEEELAEFRRGRIGAIPLGGGLIPELPVIDQLILPLKLGGSSGENGMDQIKKRTSQLLPMHSLYSIAGNMTGRKQVHAAIVRATLNQPAILILDRALDGFSEIDGDMLWEALRALRDESAVLLYFSSDPEPRQINWTKRLHI